MRKLLGYILLAISCLAWLTVPIIPFLSLSAVEKASWAGGIIIFAEIAWWLAMPCWVKKLLPGVKVLGSGVSALLVSVLLKRPLAVHLKWLR